MTWGSLAWGSRGWRPSWISYGLTVWPWARHFSSLGWSPSSVWKGGIQWPLRSSPAPAFWELWIIYRSPSHLLSMTLDLSFAPALQVLVPKSCLLQVQTNTWSLPVALSLSLPSSLFTLIPFWSNFLPSRWLCFRNIFLKACWKVNSRFKTWVLISLVFQERSKTLASKKWPTRNRV